jgi:hypothetical protein
MPSAIAGAAIPIQPRPCLLAVRFGAATSAACTTQSTA